MSTLNVANITDGTDTVATGYVVNGSAKAWVNFNGTGTVAARDSFNVSSLTDLGTGAYKVNLSNSMASGGYSVSGTSEFTSQLTHIYTGNPSTITADGWTFNTLYVSNLGGGGAVVDSTLVTAQFMGGLA